MRNWDKLLDATVRIDKILWLPACGILQASSCGEDFEDFCNDLPSRKDDPLYAALPELLEYAGREDLATVEYVAETLYNRALKTGGYLICVAVPVKKFRKNFTDYSWGHTWVQWHFAATAEDIPLVAIAYAEERAVYDAKGLKKK